MLRKSGWAKWLMLVAGVALLASCGSGGGGGGGADNLSITKTSPVSPTSTFVESGSDPMVYADITTGGAPSTEITMCSGVVGFDCTNRSIYIKIKAVAQKDATYTVGSSSSTTHQAWIYYTESGTAYDSTAGGTVSITGIDGTAGGRIQGSFSGVTVSTLGGGSSITMNGTFDVTIDSVL